MPIFIIIWLVTCCGDWTNNRCHIIVSAEMSSNKKYTAAAASAMKTINSFTSSKARQSNLPTNLLSESALMDKETNAIYWQGGASTFKESVTKPYLTQRGVVHVKATVLTIALWLWIWGHISRYLISKYFTGDSVKGHKLLFTLPFITTTTEKLHPILQRIASIIAPIIQFILLLFHSLLYLRLPQYSTKVLVSTIALYLLEAYSCSTRRYLSNGMNAPSEVETYLEKIRRVEPCVTWKVRCFHYEDRDIWKNWKGVGNILESWMNKKNNKEGKPKLFTSSSSSSLSESAFAETPPFWAARKVVTHQAVGNYKFGNWEDHTLASLWKRSQSFSSTSREAPFSKLTLSKLLVLKDRSTREDYFAQQAAFVMSEGRKDVHAEFATTIEVDGFRPKLLAVRPVHLGSSKISAVLFRQHVFFLATLLGLSLPYRIWFAKHCDEIRVTVVKETTGNVQTSTSAEGGAQAEGKSSWFGKWGRGSSSPISSSSLSSATMDSKRAQELFRKSMQQYSLYEEEQPPPLKEASSNETATNLRNETAVQPSESSAELKKDIISTQSISNKSGQINVEASTTSDSLTSIVGDSKQEELSISSDADTIPANGLPSSSMPTPKPPPPPPPPPDAPEALVIADKDGNPLDFSKDTGSSSGTNKLGSI